MKKFYLGMDIGTDSVGIAGTDENYNLLRARGKDLWAVRLFDEAKDASARRMKRTARRRLQRRKQRIEWLQELFAPYIEDKCFFLRLNNSGFEKEDKHESLQSQYSLFADAGYTDREFYKKYPTIFHLRRALAERASGEKTDLRLYYLALHHIVKYRGHFLFEGDSISDIRDIKKLFEEFNAVAEDIFPEGDIRLPLEKAEAFRALALSAKGIRDKKKTGEELFETNSPASAELVGLLLGAKAKIGVIFGEEYGEYKEEKLSFKEISDEDFEAKQELYGDNYPLLEAARSIYNYFVFEKILDGNHCISAAMVAVYERHRRDLRLLKNFVKTQFSKEIYYKIFRSEKEAANYCNYISYTKTEKKKIFVKKCKYGDFCKFLKKTLTENRDCVKDKKTLDDILFKIENGDFLPKILNADNGLFPHQINGAELDKILANLCKEYPCFAEKEADGFSVAEKIRKIFLFKIPYYVGPLNNYHEENGNSWVVRKSGKITPWNFEDMVDTASSNEKFIRRMTNKCSYLYGKDVLPKCSMYYQAFDVLNQLNKIKFNEQPISVEMKQELFHSLFLRHRKVTKKLIKEYLTATGKYTSAEAKELSVSGFDGELKANMGAYITLKNCLGDYVDEHPETCENIILWHTLNTDKTIVERQILSHYGDVPVIKEKIKALKGITSFKEFGRLSKELLCELIGGEDPVTGEVYTILNRLYHTNFNFNELLFSDTYRFNSAIEAMNAGKDGDVGYDDVKELYVSPMVRRGIWQALTMADEYVQAVGRVPDKIFIEVTRQGDEKKKPTVSRKNQLLENYKGLGQDCRNIDELLTELNDKTDSQLRQERLYLYFKQLGRCAYTGQLIRLEELNGDLYDVDHIMPRSITKDDSLENKVLVRREKNAQKSDEYPLPAGFTDQQRFWKLLRDKGLMSEKKYALLTRTKPLTEDDFRDFINRQLVVTNQTVKAVAELLKRKYGEKGTRIVYSKAKNVDGFKNQYDIVKCRETNDLHHARDAYLNIVVGNVYDTKFTSAYDYYYRKGDAWREYNLKTLFERPVKDAWIGREGIAFVKDVLRKPSMQITRYAYTNKGEFYNETIYGKDDKGISAPRKSIEPYNKTEKYGGYKSLTTAYFSVVESKDKKGKLIKTVEAIPVLVDYQSKGDREAALAYLSRIGLKEPKLLLPKIRIKSLVSVNGFKVWLAGTTGVQLILHNAQQWFTDEKTDLYIKNLGKLVEWERTGKIAEEEKARETFSMIKNRKEEVSLLIDRSQNVALYREIVAKLQTKLYQGLSAARSFAEKLSAKEEIFVSLSVLEQAKVLLQIARFMKCNAEAADLSLLKDGSRCGILLIGKNITDVDFAVIHQSPCGINTYIQRV